MQNITKTGLKYSDLKYDVLRRLNELPKSQHSITKTELPKQLGVSQRTFDGWLYIKKDESQNVPSEALAILARFFECSMESLINVEIPEFTAEDLISSDEVDSQNDCRDSDG